MSVHGGPVILVDDGPKRTVRVQLAQQGQLVVQSRGCAMRTWPVSRRPREVTATKLDETDTFSGRMPPNPGELQWHIFKIETTWPRVSIRAATHVEPPTRSAMNPWCRV
jgi:hypothetical protein